MAYEVLARKWRPQQFDDVAAQQHVTDTLKNAIKSGRLAHAYLFAGPRGIGKTSLARIFAKALNCAHGPTPTPCDKCDSCREIGAGTSFDVLEIDGASNNGVDQVRDLRENVKYAPSRGPFKIYLIDEVHMLSVPAFNALLKTLEEPPPHVKFIFATTEPQKILPTILSRCQRFDLRRIPATVIVERLGAIATAEKIRIDENALLAIARGSEGSLRDAESALDQLISFKGNAIVEEDVLSVFGLVARGTLDRLTEAILKGNVPDLIRMVAEFDAAGKDMQRLVLELLDQFRSILVYLYARNDLSVLDITEGQVKTLAAQAAMTSPDQVIRIADILVETESRLRYALSKRTQLETALIRSARAATVVSIDEIISQINALKNAMGGEAAAPTGARSGQGMPRESAPVAVAAAAEMYPADSAKAASVLKEKRGEAASVGPDRSPSHSDLERLTAGWVEIVDRIGRMAMRARVALKDSVPLAVRDDKVTIGFDPEFRTEMEAMGDARVRAAIQHVLGEVLGRAVSVDYSLIETGAIGSRPDPVSEKAAVKKKPGSGKAKHEWMEDPAVQKALETFNGTIVDIRE